VDFEAVDDGEGICGGSDENVMWWLSWFVVGWWGCDEVIVLGN
jgi:hypothetical protein